MRSAGRGAPMGIRRERLTRSPREGRQELRARRGPGEAAAERRVRGSGLPETPRRYRRPPHRQRPGRNGRPRDR